MDCGVIAMIWEDDASCRRGAHCVKVTLVLSPSPTLAHLDQFAIEYTNLRNHLSRSAYPVSAKQ